MAEPLTPTEYKLRFLQAAIAAFESAAAQLQRDCPDCKGSGQHITLKPSTGVRSAPSLTPPSACSTCEGPGKVGITALEMAEALKDGGVAELIEFARTQTDGGFVNHGQYVLLVDKVRRLLVKLQPKEAR